MIFKMIAPTFCRGVKKDCPGVFHFPMQSFFLASLRALWYYFLALKMKTVMLQ